jgi:uncharacterized protein YjiS (DUF1127 family)
MAYANTSHASGFNVSVWAENTLISLAERIALRRAYRTTLNELLQLSNRELADLGLNPANLRSVAWEAANKD